MALMLYAWSMERDFLEELIEEGAQKDPEFPDLVEEGTRRRQLVHHLQQERARLGVSQTLVAARMRTSASVLSELEAGGDVKLSTLQRYAAAVGKVLSFSLEDPPRPARRGSKTKRKTRR